MALAPCFQTTSDPDTSGSLVPLLGIGSGLPVLRSTPNTPLVSCQTSSEPLMRGFVSVPGPTGRDDDPTAGPSAWTVVASGSSSDVSSRMTPPGAPRFPVVASFPPHPVVRPQGVYVPMRYGAQ